MNLLSNIWSGVKNVASNVWGALTTPGSGASSLGKNYASPYMALQSPPPNQTYNNQTSAPLNYTPAPTGGTNSYAGTLQFPDNSLSQSYLDQAVASGALRPSTASWAPGVDIYGRTSTADLGTPFLDAKGNLIVPKNAFSGVQGFGGEGLTSMAPANASGGLMGIGGGGSNFTGLLDSAGGLNTPGVLGGDEDKRVNEKNNTPNTTTQPPTIPFIPGITPIQNNQPLNTSMPGLEVDMAELSSLMNKTNALAQSGLAETDADFQAMANNITSSFIQLYQKYNAENPLPQFPVEDTPAQTLAIQQNPGLQQAIDSWKMQNTNLDSLIKDRNNVTNQLNALIDAYSPILEDIRTNPNLPKGLAARRMEEITRQQKEALSGLLRAKEILGQQIDDANRAVNQAFQIVEFTANEDERRRDNARQDLNLYINSGAIGAFTDNELKLFAQNTGYTLNQLKAIRDSATNPNVKSQIVGSADTGYNLIIYDSKTGQQISNKKVVPGTGGSKKVDLPPAVQAWQNDLVGMLSEGVSVSGAVQEIKSTAQREWGVTLTIKDIGDLTAYANQYKNSPQSKLDEFLRTAEANRVKNTATINTI